MTKLGLSLIHSMRNFIAAVFMMIFVTGQLLSQDTTVRGRNVDEGATNVGTGVGIFKQKNGLNLEFKSLIGGTGINCVSNTNDATCDVDSTEVVTPAGNSDMSGENEINIGSTGDVTIEMANDGTTGTTLNKGACTTSAPSTAVLCGTSQPEDFLGLVKSGAGTTGDARICTDGLCSCVFDGATTAGNWVQLSGATAGNCVDAGASKPTSGNAIVGLVLTTNGTAGTYGVLMQPAAIAPGPGIIAFTLDGAGSVLTADAPAACIAIAQSQTVTSWEIFAKESGSVVVDIWRSTYANLPIDDSDRIAGTDKPTLSSAQKNTSSALTGWTTALAAGDYICAEIEGTPATITNAWVTLKTTKN